MNTLDMSSEIIEALEDKYKNEDEEIFIDCLLFLSKISSKATRTLEAMERCTECGSKLEVMYYREYHPEVDAYENMGDVYCPNCDIRFR